MITKSILDASIARPSRPKNHDRFEVTGMAVASRLRHHIGCSEQRLIASRWITKKTSINSWRVMADEDFDIDSLASFLHLNPDQVRKMAQRGKLPGRRVAGRWRFSRAEIHHWFENRIGSSDEEELEKVERMLVDQATREHREEFSLLQLLTVDRIAVPLAARTKNSVIETLCNFAADSGSLWMPNEMADAIRNREDLHPTALENGVALLHPRRPQPSMFGESFLALGITTKGIPFGGPRGCLTDIFFLLALENESLHLRVLAKISRLLSNRLLLQELRVAENAAMAWRSIADADDQMN